MAGTNRRNLGGSKTVDPFTDPYGGSGKKAATGSAGGSSSGVESGVPPANSGKVGSIGSYEESGVGVPPANSGRVGSIGSYEESGVGVPPANNGSAGGSVGSRVGSIDSYAASGVPPANNGSGGASSSAPATGQKTSALGFSYDSLPEIASRYSDQIDAAVRSYANREPFTYEAAPEYTSKYADTLDRLTNALINREPFSYGQAAPAFTSRYDGQINDLAAAYQNRDPFSYDPLTDPLYAQYRKQYTREGQRASADVLGQYAAMTGGMPSTAAVAASQQAGDYYAAQMADKIPELYQLAYNIWKDQGDRQLSQINLLRNLDSDDYNRYLNALAQYNTDRSFAYNQYQDEYSQAQNNLSAVRGLENDAYNQYLNTLNQYNTDRNFAYGLYGDELNRQLDDISLLRQLDSDDISLQLNNLSRLEADRNFDYNVFSDDWTRQYNQDNEAWTRQYNRAIALAQNGDASALYALGASGDDTPVPLYAGVSGSGQSYNIGSEKGIQFIQRSAAGATMEGGDGSQWRKNADGSTTITKDGVAYTVPNPNAQQATPLYAGFALDGSSYNVGSEQGLSFIEYAASGATMEGGDGSHWTKMPDGSTQISKDGKTFIVPGATTYTVFDQLEAAGITDYTNAYAWLLQNDYSEDAAATIAQGYVSDLQQRGMGLSGLGGMLGLNVKPGLNILPDGTEIGSGQAQQILAAQAAAAAAQAEASAPALGVQSAASAFAGGDTSDAVISALLDAGYSREEIAAQGYDFTAADAAAADAAAAAAQSQAAAAPRVAYGMGGQRGLPYWTRTDGAAAVAGYGGYAGGGYTGSGGYTGGGGYTGSGGYTGGGGYTGSGYTGGGGYAGGSSNVPADTGGDAAAGLTSLGQAAYHTYTDPNATPSQRESAARTLSREMAGASSGGWMSDEYAGNTAALAARYANKDNGDRAVKVMDSYWPEMTTAQRLAALNTLEDAGLIYIPDLP